MMALPISQSTRRYQFEDLTDSIWLPRWLRLLLTGASLLLYPALAAAQTPTVPASAAPPDDGQWTMPAKNYGGPDGREYVAILSGVGGWPGAIVAGDLDPRDPTGALGMNGVMADLKTKTAPGGTLYVFALPKS